MDGVDAIDRPSGAVAGMLLTGGGSRRMGRDKAAIVVAGERLADRTAALLAAVADPVVEVGPGYSGLPHTLEDPPGSGPLAAVAAGAARLTTGTGGIPAALVVATDLPRLSLGLLGLLAGHPGPGCVVPLDAGGRAQLVCARYSADALTRAPGLLAAGHRSLRALLDGVEVTWLPPEQWIGAAGTSGALTDVDTPEDLAAARQAAGS